MLNRRHCLAAAAALGLSRPAWPAGTAPVLVELFTSQGCSSCPPADATLTKLALRDDVVALSFHVDYWDNLGWNDPFASRAHTRRQRDYARAFGNRSVYTPQMVFDGRLEGAVQSDGAAVDMLDRIGARPPSAGPNQLTRNGKSVSIAMAALPPAPKFGRPHFSATPPQVFRAVRMPGAVWPISISSANSSAWTRRQTRSGPTSIRATGLRSGVRMQTSVRFAPSPQFEPCAGTVESVNVPPS